MKKVFLLLMLLLLPGLVYAWGCGDEHCKVRAGSIFFEKIEASTDANRPDYGLVTYTLDLNYINGAVPVDELGVEGEDWFRYYFNNWYSSKYIDLSSGGYYEIKPIDPDRFLICDPKSQYEDYAGMRSICGEHTSEDECENDDRCEWNEKNKFQSVNYLGLPFYIHKCYVDCDYSGSSSDSCEPDGTYDAMYDYSTNSYTDLIHLSGSAWLNDTESELYSTPSYLLSDGIVRVHFTHKCDWDSGVSDKNAQVYCKLAPNLAYRHDSAEDADWTYEEIVGSLFNGYDFNNHNVKICSGLKVNMSDDTYNPWGLNVSQMEDTMGVVDHSSGTEAVVLEEIDEALKNFYGSNTFIKQYRSNLEMIDLQHRISWQNSILSVLDAIASIVLLVYYVFILTVIVTVVLVKIPGVFRKAIDVFKEFTKIKEK